MYLSDSFVHDWKRYLSYRFFLGILVSLTGQVGCHTSFPIFGLFVLVRDTVLYRTALENSTPRTNKVEYSLLRNYCKHGRCWERSALGVEKAFFACEVFG